MKKPFSLILLIIFINLPVYSSVIYKTGSLYGMKNDNGKVILKPEYQSIEQLSYTPSKKVIIPMHSMDEIKSKKLNLYKIKKNGLYGVSNSQGHILNECDYKDIQTEDNGEIKLVLKDGSIEYAHPVKNTMKTISNAATSIVGLPVTIVGVMMMPIEAISKVGQKR